jgi:hypothetical protein
MMWERGWVLVLLSVLAAAANLALGNGWPAAAGAGIAVLVFGELAWRFTVSRQRHPYKQPVRPRKEVSAPPPRVKPDRPGGSDRLERWEWDEVGIGIATMALGLGALVIPPNIPIIGNIPSWVGLGVAAIGLAFCLLSAGTYLLQLLGRR